LYQESFLSEIVPKHLGFLIKNKYFLNNLTLEFPLLQEKEAQKLISPSPVREGLGVRFLPHLPMNGHILIFEIFE